MYADKNKRGGFAIIQVDILVAEIIRDHDQVQTTTESNVFLIDGSTNT